MLYDKLKDLQMDNEGRDILLGTDRVLGATLEAVSQDDNSIIKATGGAIHDTLNGICDFDEKMMESLEEATSKVTESGCFEDWVRS